MNLTLRELGASLSRNKSMTISLVVTMTVSLMLAALGLLIQAQAERTEQYYGERLQLQVTLCTDSSKTATCIGGAASDAQKEAVQEALRDNPQVSGFDVRTAQQNYERAVEQLGHSDTGRRQLEVLSPETFSDSYFVTLNDPEEFDGVVSQVSGMDGVNSVLSLRDLLSSLFIALERLQWAAIGTALLLIFAAVLQVSNTIRMTAHARRREISIMRYVGASSWHIQMPFLLESLVAALISAVLAALGLAAFMAVVVDGFLRDRLAITTWVRWQDAFVVMGWTSLLAVALALLPTVLLTRKYLNV